MGAVERLIDQPITLEAVIAFLVNTPLFADLDTAERGEVVRIMEVQRLQQGEVVFREGEDGESWYVIFEGGAEVLKAAGDGSERPLRSLEPGDCFGELAILDGSPRSATIRAAGPLTLFRFRRPLFDELLADGSLGAYKLVAAMARSQARRLRQLTSQVSGLLDANEGAGRPAGGAIGELVDRYTISE
jgi:CRP/FNR family cyclic AMP-dependent transcriptional regulator